MVIWHEVSVRLLSNKPHVHHVGGKLCRRLCPDFGDLPVARFNEITGRIEPVLNLRGRAYAARNRRRYRRRPRGIKEA